MRTLQQLAREALDVQDACNLLGVSKGFARSLQELADVLRAANLPSDTPTVNNHPIARLWASKIHDMTGMGFSDTDRFGKAYDACLDAAQEQLI